MKLPSDSIGISDILDYRECPQRFAFKMRRHTPLPERFQFFPGEKAEPPEAMDENNAYGSCVHDAIAIVEKEAVSDDEAIRRVWPDYQHFLDPTDLELLKHDLELYHQRSHTGYRLIANEMDMKVPLFVYKGTQIYFRFKVDALYQHIQNPGIWLLRDYKSTKWPKSEAEWRKDLQQWAYQWGVIEMYPEIVTLLQEVDQLKAGVVPLPMKPPDELKKIKAWLIQQVTAILDDETLKPYQNDWCAYCPIIMDCRVTHLSTDYWKRRLAATAPEKKVGRKILVELTEGSEDFSLYTDMVVPMSKTHKMMERFMSTVKEAVKKMPSEERKRYADISTKKATKWNASALKRIHERVGAEFYHLVGLTKTAVEEMYEKDDPRRTDIEQEAEVVDGSTVVKIR